MTGEAFDWSATARFGLLWLLSLAAAGCADRVQTWTERTAGLDRVYHVDGRRDRPLVFRESGPNEARLTLLLIHGLGSSKACWQYVLPRLERQHRVVMMDLPGFGDSDRPPGFDGSIGAQADVVRKFILERRLENLVIVGWSYGGAVALETVLPFFRGGGAERFRGLVLLAPCALAFRPPRGYAYAQDPLVRFYLTWLAPPSSIAAILLSGSFADEARIPPELRREYERTAARVAARQATIRAGREIFRELAARRHDPHRYEAIGCPVLLVWGDRDEIVPPEVMHRLADVLPRASMHVIPDCGHSPAEEWPDKLLDALHAFLEEVSGAGRGQERTHPRASAPGAPDRPVLRPVLAAS